MKKFRVEKVTKRESDKLCVKWKDYNYSFNSWINKKTQYKFKKNKYKLDIFLLGNIQVELDLANYATKADLKNATGNYIKILDKEVLGKKMCINWLKKLMLFRLTVPPIQLKK